MVVIGAADTGAGDKSRPGATNARSGRLLCTAARDAPQVISAKRLRVWTQSWTQWARYADILAGTEPNEHQRFWAVATCTRCGPKATHLSSSTTC
jgi:hypothetical protein